jgi:HAD superfamily hydrolase (TIGR01509 family)
MAGTIETNIIWIFCDLDGTLVDSIPAMCRVYLEFLKTFRIDGSEEEFDELNGPSLREIVFLLKKRYELEEDLESLCDLYKAKVSDAYRRYVNPMEGAEKALQDIAGSGYRLLLTTSATREIAHELVKSRGWDQYFQQYVYGDEVSNSKPAPDIYALALSKADADPKNVVAVEDSPNGIKSAKSEGIYVIGLAMRHSGEELVSAGADRVAGRLGEILSMIET